MSDWPSLEGQGYISAGTVRLTGLINLGSYGDVSGATKGTWTDLIRSTPYDSDGFVLSVGPTDSTSRNISLDIGLGKASGTAFLVNTLTLHPSVGEPSNFYLPLTIPNDSQVSIRYQANTNSTTLEGMIHLGKFGFLMPAGFNRSETWGAQTTSAGVTTIDSGAVANTKGSWTQLVASTGRQTKAISLLISTPGATNISADSTVLLDIGTGSSGSETAILSNIPCTLENINNVTTPNYGPFLIDIPAGARVSARAQSASTTLANRQIGLTIIAFS